MYPALQYGTLFNAADLPDFIRITINDEIGGTVIASKDGATYVYGNYGDIDDLRLGIDNFTWVFIPNADNLSSYNQPCLLNNTEAEFTIEDTFLDTYAITSSDPDPFFQGCDSITRVNLCTWLHPLEGCDLTTTLRGRIFYHDGTTTIYEQEAPHGWYYDFGQENFVRKNDPQNSPEGIYDLGFVSYTVS
jgi:hypothetical protein